MVVACRWRCLCVLAQHTTAFHAACHLCMVHTCHTGAAIFFGLEHIAALEGIALVLVHAFSMACTTAALSRNGCCFVLFRAGVLVRALVLGAVLRSVLVHLLGRVVWLRMCGCRWRRFRGRLCLCQGQRSAHHSQGTQRPAKSGIPLLLHGSVLLEHERWDEHPTLP